MNTPIQRKAAVGDEVASDSGQEIIGPGAVRRRVAIFIDEDWLVRSFVDGLLRWGLDRSLVNAVNKLSASVSGEVAKDAELLRVYWDCTEFPPATVHIARIFRDLLNSHGPVTIRETALQPGLTAISPDARRLASRFAISDAVFATNVEPGNGLEDCVALIEDVKSEGVKSHILDLSAGRTRMQAELVAAADQLVVADMAELYVSSASSM